MIRFYGTPHADHRLPGLSVAHLAGTTPEHEVAEHSHDDAHFVLATRGRYLTTARGEAAEGPVLVYNPPGVVHRDRFAGEGGWFLAVSFGAGAWRDLAPRAADNALRLTRPGSLRKALALTRAATAEDPDALHLEALALELAGDVDRATPASGHPPPWLATAEAFIADQLAAGITVGDIARAAGVHPVHLARTFRRWLGCSPGDRLRQRRLERAADLLGRRRADLGETALQAGFCDQSHLNRVFRQAWDMAPGEYRRLASGGKVSYVQDGPRRGG